MRDDLVVLLPSDFMIFGSNEKVDVLLSREDVSLLTLLTNVRKNEAPIVFDYEVLLSGNIGGIGGYDDLAREGINISDDRRCVYVGKDWKFAGKKSEGKFTCERYAKEGLVLESVIPVRKMDCCSHAFFSG